MSDIKWQIELMQAFLDGTPIEYTNSCTNQWFKVEPFHNFHFGAGGNTYRYKKSPIEKLKEKIGEIEYELNESENYEQAYKEAKRALEHIVLGLVYGTLEEK